MHISVFVAARIALGWFTALIAFMPILATASETSVKILFVGNSFTHGRYEPVRGYNAGFGPDNVHDLLCPSLASCSIAEQGGQIDPSETPPPGTTLSAQLAYLQANSSARYNEPGPLRRGTRNFLTVYARCTSPLFRLGGCSEQRNAHRLPEQYGQ
jgi:hypothetical protein